MIFSLIIQYHGFLVIEETERKFQVVLQTLVK